MVSPGTVIHRRIIESYASFVKEAAAHVDPPVAEKMRGVLERLEKTRPPPLPTKRFSGAIEILVHKYHGLREAYEMYRKGRVSLEELRGVLREFEQAAETYMRVCRGEARRLFVIAATPMMIVVVGVLYQVAVLHIYGSLILIASSLALAAVAVILVQSSMFAAGLLGALAGFAAASQAIAAAPEYADEATGLGVVMLFTFYVISTLLSISYMHLAHTAGSEKTLDKIERLMETVLARRETGGEKPGPGDEKIYQELLEIYRGIYGERGKEYLDYRLTLLVMSGFMRSNALRKLLEETKSFKKGSG